jgi:exo-1,4-beta-D-glucosaminidase
MLRKRMTARVLGWMLGAGYAASCAYAVVPGNASSAVMELKQGWSVQSGCKVQGDGATFSKGDFHPKGWYSAAVPATVVAVQVASGEFKDPYFGMNLRSIPGTTYPIGHNFSNIDMPTDSPYRCGWWYRKSFRVPASERGKTLWLRFGGINYKANIWLNGQKIADASQVEGAYRTYELDVTKVAKAGAENILAVETFAPQPTNLGINWVDWNPAPPDKDMGLWGAVSLTESGPVSVRAPMATTHFTDDSLQTAELTVLAEVKNAADHPVQGKLEGTVAGVRISQPVELAAGEGKTVTFAPDAFPQLKVQHPQVWWPAYVGKHPLETLTLRFVTNGGVSDEQSIKFGIREVNAEMTPQGYKLFRVNGRPILIRGAGWSQDMLLREDPVKLEQQFRLVQDMHLNTIRLEGKMETEDFFRLADERGILVMAGWCCCDHWEHWKKWTPEDLEVATASLRSQSLRLRSHPSLLVWLNGSDGPPPADVETAYLNVLKETHWPNPVISSAADKATTVTGPSGVKMSGPYDYVAPSYWLRDEDKKYGGAYGFNTETGPGPAIPSLDSLKKMLPAKDLWPQDEVWDFHAGGGGFQNTHVFNAAMNATYGTPESGEVYNRVAQTMAFDGERAMFEAYGRNKYISTGVVQWMLNNAWPATIWHLYDYYLDAGGGYYGTKQACELLHVQYSYDDHSIYVVNSVYTAAPALTVSASVYDVKLHELFHNTTQIDSASDSSTKAMDIPKSVFRSGSPVYFVRLELKKSTGEVLSHNFYWVPEKLTEFDWAKTKYTYTPAKTYEDMTALNSLPTASIEASMTARGNTLHVHLKNPSKALAFQLSAEARDAKGEKIDPQMWNSNYIELMPGEERELSVELPEHLKNPGRLSVVVSGWNVKTITAVAASQKMVAER